ncbi:hypothetical protein SBBP2_890025 [Burkholderiales bacterium]|jgi:hypothetical protein|nr:hypothetical protein SBBP2_890025 [Burkholderiales bacterium]
MFPKDQIRAALQKAALGDHEELGRWIYRGLDAGMPGAEIDSIILEARAEVPPIFFCNHHAWAKTYNELKNAIRAGDDPMPLAIEIVEMAEHHHAQAIWEPADIIERGRNDVDNECYAKAGIAILAASAGGSAGSARVHAKVALLATTAKSAPGVPNEGARRKQPPARQNGHGEPPQWFDDNAPPASHDANTPPPEYSQPKKPADGGCQIELPQPIDIRHLAATEPAPPRSIMPGIPEGEVSLLGSHGGYGKSEIGLHFATCSAAGRPFFGVPVQQRRVAFFSMEDRPDILHWRLARICAWLGVDIASLAGRLDLIDATSCGPLMDEMQNAMVHTTIYQWIRERMAGQQVLIVDGASDAFGGREISRAQVRAFIRSLRKLIPDDGAVVLLAHVDKVTARNGDTTEGYSGSTAWNNSCRARWYLRREDSGELRLELQKANYSALGAQFAIRWNDSAHCFVGELILPAGRMERELLAQDARETIVRIIGELSAAGTPCPTATAGPRTAYHVLSAHASFPACFKAKGSARQFWNALETLRTDKRITTGFENSSGRNKREVFHVA